MDIKKYRDYIEGQSDLEIGVILYAQARRLLDEFINEREKNLACDKEIPPQQIRTALALAEEHFRKTRNENYLILVKRLNQVLSEIGI